jgi:hypothetical protein
MTFRLPIRSGRLTADISALADGSIPPERRRHVEQQIEASNDLRRRFEEERAAADLLRHAREHDRAPESLRRRVAHERFARSGQVRSAQVAWRPRTVASGLAAAAAVAGATVVLLLAGGPTSGPSLAQAAGLATRGALSPGPGVNPRDPRALLQRVGEVDFPNWGYTLGWSVTGQRADRLDSHLAVTVYYSWRGRAVAYTIVSIPALSQPHAHMVMAGGLRLRVLSLSGRRIVTWRRDGRTCVLSSRDVPAQQLERLAAWS